MVGFGRSVVVAGIGVGIVSAEVAAAAVAVLEAGTGSGSLGSADCSGQLWTGMGYRGSIGPMGLPAVAIVPVAAVAVAAGMTMAVRMAR